MSQPPGTFLPNTKVTVGSHKVHIEKYLSEGGFAHVYVVRVPREGGKHELAVLKRVAVPDKEHLANMRTEVETMKKLKGHRRIVTYYDSHASQLHGGGYEVFLLMEYCSGGGLIDFMNTRLQHRLTEPEILKIFADCAEGVACMHYLKPPLLHRDLKVENVLISKSSDGKPIYKICDFGSSAPPRPAAKTTEEGRLIEEDVQKHTTMQYRSPEMIDVWRKQPINEKADIWALGVLLYKLCYYTTPFEAVGQMAILNASFKFPSHPAFSERLKKLTGWMLKEDPAQRPNIYQVIKEVCSMRGTEIPIKDIYANRTQSEVRRNESLPSQESLSNAPVGLQKTAPQIKVQQLPEVTPMRRGRPTAPAQQAPTTVAKPAASPARGDPFAALDSKSYDERAGAVDELSKRFPSLDEFSIATEGGKFPFPSNSPSASSNGPDASSKLNQRVTNALADQVFTSTSQPPQALRQGQVPQKTPAPTSAPRKVRQNASANASARSTIPSTMRDSLASPPVSQPRLSQPSPVRAGFSGYKSTAVGSSPPPAAVKIVPEISTRPIWRVPDHSRAESQPRASSDAQAAASSLKPSLPLTERPELLDIHRSKSQTATTLTAQSANSSRPSLEGHRPLLNEIDESGIARTRSLNARSRPSSMYVDSNMDYLRDQEHQRKRPSLEIRRHSRHPSQHRDPGAVDPVIENDMDYLRNSEDGEVSRKASKGHHKKRSSLGQIGANAKSMFSGRFGDAFKRFEQNENRQDQGTVTPEAIEFEDEPRLLSPIAGSEAATSRHSDLTSEIDETEDLPPDVKRELERQRLVQEEKRVAAAAEEYRTRIATQGTSNGAPSRASTIQKRVQSLLDEGRQSPKPQRTAEGYGKYTANVDNDTSSQTGSSTQPNVAQLSGARPPVIAPKPSVSASPSGNPYLKTRQQPMVSSAATIPAAPQSASAPPEQAPLQRTISRPSAPPKPKAFRTGGAVQWPPPQSPGADKPVTKPTSGLAALLAKDLEGVPDYPPSGSTGAQNSTKSSSVPENLVEVSPTTADDLETFSKRYPSLSGIEMVETEIVGGEKRMMRVKEV